MLCLLHFLCNKGDDKSDDDKIALSYVVVHRVFN